MRKGLLNIMTLLACAVLVFCAAACSAAPYSSQGVTPLPDEAPASDTLELAPEQTQPVLSEEASAALTTLMGSVYNDYHSGTAGCSLVAARLAGMLLDYEAEYSPDTAGVREAAHEYALTLPAPEEDEPTYAQQLDDVRYQALELCGENAADILDTCGYTPVEESWDAQRAQAFFDALLEGVQSDE